MRLVGYGKVSRMALISALVTIAGSTFANQPAPESDKRTYEVMFLKNMMNHHAAAVEMATDCERKARHEDLRELCTDVRMAQTKEIGTMRDWLRGWYGVSYAPHITPENQEVILGLRAMSGGQYEINFMGELRHHHVVALRNAATCLEGSYHNALYSTCGKMIEMQLMEMQLLTQWRCDWYYICKGGMMRT